MATLDQIDQTDLKEIARSIAEIPPGERWTDIKDTLPPNTAAFEEGYWLWLGRYLDGFWCGNGNPLPGSGLSEEMQVLIKNDSQRYMKLAYCIYEAEEFITLEASRSGRKLPSQKPKDWIKVIALEEFESRIILAGCDFESPSKRQIQDRFTEFGKYQSGKLDAIALQNRLARWKREDDKLAGDRSTVAEIKRWTKFLHNTFEKHKKEIPSYQDYIKSLRFPKSDDPRSDFRKFGIFNGEFKEFPNSRKP